MRARRRVLREYTLPSPEFAEERVAHHPEPRKGSLLEYCLCVIPSVVEGSEPKASKANMQLVSNTDCIRLTRRSAQISPLALLGRNDTIDLGADMMP